MGDRMDQLIAAAVRQHFKVWQTRTGAWVFSRHGLTITRSGTPETARDWMELINALRGAGLQFPPD